MPSLDWSAWLSGFAKEFTSDHLKAPLNLLIGQLIRGSVSQLLDPSTEAIVRNQHAQLLKGAIEGIHKANGEQKLLVEVSLRLESFSPLTFCTAVGRSVQEQPPVSLPKHRTNYIY